MVDHKPHILFVEDDVGKRYVIARQLRAAGFHIDEAETGEEGLAKIHKDHDVAILDMKLPDMYGWDVCRRIKSNPETAGVKVLELSATLATAEDRARGLQLGADAYLVHPVEMVELIASLGALIRLRQAERDKARAFEMFLATLGHDLRNPLSTIGTGLSLLAESPRNNESDRDIVMRLQRTLARMKRMIDQLVVFTQSMTDVVPVSRQRIELSTLCELVARDAAHGTERKLVLQLQPEAWINADVDKLNQLVDNLIGNAVRHGDGPITVRVARELRHVVLQVHNGGSPIAPDALATLFDPFKRANGRAGGFGLGLYIVDQIARVHDASVDVESTVETGTTFTVRFPLDVSAG
ncbi:MAG: response regulator [Deltaproteobacteria bacterium]|nr:response regulator [Deltaproteobacteria bacterium]MDQ3296778.1 ATP-binding protein [Myxococcota bacterium]